MTKNVKRIEKDSNLVIRILQLSDSHLFGDVAGTLLGLNTEASFEAVLHDVEKRGIERDLILLTGDLSQDESNEAYQRLSKHVEGLRTPSFWIPGNHDDLSAMATHLRADNLFAEKQILIGDWNIILLNSQVPGKVHGLLGEDQQTFLEQALSQFPHYHALVVMHHHPIPMECDWLDNIGVRNGKRFWEILDKYPQKTSVLWGHVHQELETTHRGYHCMSTPSTCIQFKPRSQDFAADVQGPGYRVLDLLPSGVIESDVYRVVDASLAVDFSIKGY